MPTTLTAIIAAAAAYKFRRYGKPLAIIAAILLLLPLLNAVTGGAISATLGGVLLDAGAPSGLAEGVDNLITYGRQAAGGYYGLGL